LPGLPLRPFHIAVRGLACGTDAPDSVSDEHWDNCSYGLCRGLRRVLALRTEGRHVSSEEPQNTLGQDMVGAVLASQMSGETPVVGQGTGEAIAMLTDTTPGATDSPADAAPVVLQDPPPQVVSARSRRPLWIAAAVVGVALVVGGVFAFRSGSADPSEFQPALSEGLAAYTAGDFDQAVVNYSRAAEARPDMPTGRYNVGLAYEQLNKVGDAIENYEAAIEIDSGYVPALYNVARLYDQQGKVDLAKQRYRAVIAKKGSSVGADLQGAAHLNLGLILQREGATAEATSLFAEAARLDPSLPVPSA
jgi:tetratricopeptide (TPR) repeat protein